MTEMQELTTGKSFGDLFAELYFQVEIQDESKGGNIVNHVLNECEKAAKTEGQKAILEHYKDTGLYKG